MKSFYWGKKTNKQIKPLKFQLNEQASVEVLDEETPWERRDERILLESILQHLLGRVNTKITIKPVWVRSIQRVRVACQFLRFLNSE